MECLSCIRRWFKGRKAANESNEDTTEIICVRKSIVNIPPFGRALDKKVTKEPINGPTNSVPSQVPRRHKRQAPPPPRVPTCSFLFLGLDSSGISSTMSTIFNVESENITNGLKIREISGQIVTEKSSTTTNVKIIDVPGVGKGNYIEEDAELVIALQSYLTQSIPNQIPNVVFIVTRFDDNRFEGQSSSFSKMLIALKHSSTFWTDSSLSNIILVLTHAWKVKQEQDQRILKFQKTFHQIFPQYEENIMVSYVLVDNLNDQQESKHRMLDAIHTVRESRKDRLLPGMTTLLTDNQPPYIQNMEQKLVEIKELLPPTRRKVNQLLELLLEGNSSDLSAAPSQFFQDSPPQYIYQSYYSSKHNYSASCNFTKLLPHSQVILADHTRIQVGELNVGDRLLNMELQPVTVRRLHKINSNSCEDIGIYLVADFDIDCDSISVFKYINFWKKISKVDHKQEQADLDWRMGKFTRDFEVYEIELEIDSMPGTFIVDDYVVYDKQPSPWII